jgi:Arc/MetJ family transcription regulator
MRTSIALDDELVEEASRLTGISVKKDLVHEALRVLIASRKRRSLLALDGEISFSKKYDYKKLREKKR